uniref:Uncharacterized protein n=1 Tax=Anguilla anguilla TaxID=7936 RepID=A0A0E9V9Z4_ANGAN
MFPPPPHLVVHRFLQISDSLQRPTLSDHQRHQTD